ncbi:hypothetical protein PMI06_008959 [Burkholderia sp. BT03]|jgi:translation initiation factor 2 alpha subunit (eIF-2alpha)|nr:hypothetical protein PMI06_008959 [Burkholderia sp. BT03]SKC55273.1 hypothetical protein SAMN06266956_0714 [Paraburkholderia hospita]
MSSPLHREIDAPRYRVVVNGRPAYRAESPSADAIEAAQRWAIEWCDNMS